MLATNMEEGEGEGAGLGGRGQGLQTSHIPKPFLNLSSLIATNFSFVVDAILPSFA